MRPYCVWIPIHTGKYLKFFHSYDEANLFIIKFGGGLEIIANTYETY